MADWVHYFNLGAASGGLVAALLGLVVTVSAPYMAGWGRRYLCFMFGLLSAYIASDLVGQIAQYFFGTGFSGLARVAVFCELLFSVAIVPSLTAYLLHCAKEDWRSSRLFHAALLMYGAYVAVIAAAQFGDGVYYFSAELRCVLPGPLGAALFIPPLLLMALNLFGLALKRGKLTPRQRAACIACNAGPLLSTLLQAALFGMSILVIGTSLSSLAMLGLILADQVEAHVRQREEAARRRAQVMALQMRPHFIYNVMTSIYYLCDQDPARAQQVTLDFTDYLRANFDAVAQEGPVPFSKELEHTRAYLAVEQARLDDHLIVEIDCPHTAFRLPPLTLQPLVENAVKHGADPELEPLRVRIATAEEPGFSTVVVEDTGPGLGNALPPGNGAPGADKPAAALDNIRERLSASGSALEIAPRQGGGTVVTVRIPSHASSASSASGHPPRETI